MQGRCIKYNRYRKFLNPGFRPEVAVETQRLLDSDLLVVHFPIWWLGMPAILNGWMDRVFMYGKMYRSVMRREKDDRLRNQRRGRRFLLI
ncbi:MAG: hypothetical protein DSY90_13345 [Deltaproteobacteria bacterium]|nr:MAG: hypothetical protein DSY90_13345 [Deltaproteobacteria bacterium]